MYKLTETEVLSQPSEYVDEKNFTGRYSYETGEGDGGYLDTFNALKVQVDHNYIQYKEQLRNIMTKRESVKDDVRTALKLLLIDALIPVAYILLLLVLMFLGKYYGLFAVFYVFLNILFYPLAFICEIVLLPGLVKNLINYKMQDEILNSGKYLEKYKKSNNIITFEDEKKFLKKMIREYETFYELVIVEGLDKKDGNLGNVDTDEMTPEQQKIIDKMRSLSIFKEYHATIVETRRKVGIEYFIVITVVIIVGGLFALAKMTQ